MAEFNPKVESVGTNNYINYSSRSSGNQGWGTLFEGLVKGADQMVETSVRKQVNSMVSGLDNEIYGLDSVAADITGEKPDVPAPGTSVPGGTPVNDMPTPLRDGIQSVQMMTKAKEAGSMSPGNYSAQLYSRVKALKAQYPGYSADIDDMVRTAYNAPAANMLRSQVIDAMQGRRSAEEKALDERKKFIDKNSQYLSDDEAKEWATTGDISDDSFMNLRYRSARLENELKGNEVLQSRLRLELTGMERDGKITEQAQKTAGQAARGEFQSLSNELIDGSGGIESLNSKIDQFNADGIMDQDELRQVMEGAREIEMLIDKRFNGFMSKVVGPTGETLASVLTKEDMNDLQGDRDYLKTLLTPITGGNKEGYSVLKQTANLIAADRDNDVLRLWDTKPFKVARQLGALGEASGGATTSIVNALINQRQYDTKQTPLISGIKSLLAGETLANGGSPTETADKLSGVLPSADVNNLVAFQVDLDLDVVSNNTLPIDQRMNAAKSLITNNEGFFDKVSAKVGKDGLTERERVFRKINTPDFAKSIIELGKTDPKLLSDYSQMILDGGKAIMKPYTDTTQDDIVELNKYATLRFDPSRKEFIVNVDESRFKNPERARQFLKYHLSGQKAANLFLTPGPDVTGLDTADASQLARLRRGLEAVKSLNVYVAGVVPLIEASGGQVEPGVMQALGALNLEAPKNQATIDWVLSGFQSDPQFTAPTTEESDTYVRVPDEPLEVSPSMLMDGLQEPEKESNLKTRGMALPDGTQIEPASLTVDGDSATQFKFTNNDIRAQGIQLELKRRLGTAVEDVLGEGYTVEVYSGGQPSKEDAKKNPLLKKERTGTRRHDYGNAADVRIIGPDGKQVKDRAVLDQLADYWEQNGNGSVGKYMRGMGMHFDLITKDKLLPKESTRWNY